MKKIAIIGAGISGLATGYALHRHWSEVVDRSDDIGPTTVGSVPTHGEFAQNASMQNASITIFESSDRMGGLIQTESIGEFLIDHGADMFATHPPAAMELCEQLGIADQLLLPQIPRRGARIYSGGKLVPIPEGFVLMRATKTWPMLTTPLLSWTAKLRFLAERFCKRGSHDDDFDESVADFVTRRMGRSVLDKIVAPLAAGIYTADVNRLSMRSTMKLIHQMEKDHGSLFAATKSRARAGEDGMERTSTGARYGQFRAFPRGMTQFIQSIANGLPSHTVRLNTAVTDIEPVKDRWRLQFDRGQGEVFDRVVISVPARPAARLLRPVSNSAADALDSIRFASAAIVVLAVKRSQVSKDIETFGFVVPPSDGRKILAGSFSSHKFAGRAPDDRVIVRCFVGGMLHPKMMLQSDDELICCVRNELKEMIGLHGDPEVEKVVRWPEAMPQYEVGHHRKIATIENAFSELPNLFLSNNALYGVGIAPVVKQSQQTAQAIIDSLAKVG